MKTVRKSTLFGLFTAAILSVGCLVSCNQKQNSDSEIDAMRARLNAIMLEHQQMQLDYENYTSNLAAKDSAIQAQAQEIERLLAELKAAQNAKPRVAGDNSARLNKQAAELKAKQGQIVELENRLEQQTRELAALREIASRNGNNVSEQDLTTITRLQREIDDQDLLIADLSNEKVVLTNRNDSLVALVAFLTSRQQPASADANAQYAVRVAQLEGQVNQQQEEIERLQAELKEQIALVAEAQGMAESAKSDAAASKKAAASTKGAVNKKLAELEEMCNKYAEEIARLKAENEQLKNENDSLRTEVSSMRQEAEQTALANAKLAQKVSQAAILVTKDLSVTPLKRVASNSGKETNRASAVTTLKIDGVILDNNVVDPGSVVIYVRITNGAWQLVYTPRYDGRGELVPQEFDLNGEKVIYTVAQTVEFTGESRPFTIVWNKGEDVELTAGIYKVALFANGNIIGTTTFRLK